MIKIQVNMVGDIFNMSVLNLKKTTTTNLRTMGITK